MNRPGAAWLYWAPRALGIVFALWLSVFALDVFGEGYGFRGMLVALFMHLIPTIIVFAVLAIAWRWEGAGGLLFAALGVWNLVRFGSRLHWSWFLAFCAPLFLIAALFLAHWALGLKRRRAA